MVSQQCHQGCGFFLDFHSLSSAHLSSCSSSHDHMMTCATLGLMSDIQMELRKMGQKQRLIPDEALAYLGREVLP